MYTYEYNNITMFRNVSVKLVGPSLYLYLLTVLLDLFDISSVNSMSESS